MGVENFQYDGTTLLSNADNVEADGAVLSEIQADGVVYWQRDTGAAGTDVVLPSSVSVTSLALSPDNAIATLKFNNDGTITRDYQTTTGFVSNEFLANWVNDPNDVGFDGSNYEIEAVLNSGDTPSGDVLGSFLALSSNRSWTLQENLAGSDKTALLTFTVREIADPTGNVDSCNGNMFANKEN